MRVEGSGLKDRGGSHAKFYVWPKMHRNYAPIRGGHKKNEDSIATRALKKESLSKEKLERKKKKKKNGG